MSFKYPPNWQIKKILRQKCTFVKVTVHLIDDEYGQSYTTTKSYEVSNVEIQPVTSEDLVFIPPGVLNIGDARGFFKELLEAKICTYNFNVPGEYSYDSQKIIVENGSAKLKAGIDPCYPYPTDNPDISNLYPCEFNVPPVSIEVEESKPDKTEIKYILSADGGITWYYWDGSDWITSDGTYSQSSTSGDIINNFSKFPFDSGELIWKAFLHSDDGTATPELKKIKITFGIKMEVGDKVIDHQGVEYTIERIIDYYTNNKVYLKEVYLKKVRG